MTELLRLLKQVCPEVDFENQGNLVSDGVIDSLSIVKIIDVIELNYSIKLCGDDIIPENFESLECILSMINRLR